MCPHRRRIDLPSTTTIGRASRLWRHWTRGGASGSLRSHSDKPRCFPHPAFKPTLPPLRRRRRPRWISPSASPLSFPTLLPPSGRLVSVGPIRDQGCARHLSPLLRPLESQPRFRCLVHPRRDRACHIHEPGPPLHLSKCRAARTGRHVLGRPLNLQHLRHPREGQVFPLLHRKRRNSRLARGSGGPDLIQGMVGPPQPPAHRRGRGGFPGRPLAAHGQAADRCWPRDRTHHHQCA